MTTAPLPSRPATAAINGHTRVFLILGDPVGQVRAPEVFNPLFARHGVNAVLVPARVAAADLASFATTVLRAGNIDGLWLTIPHKSALLPLLAHCDARGQVAGAINALRRNADGTLAGALFDGLGFVKGLDHFGLAVAGRRVLLLGAGGAGLAIATALAERGAAGLAIFDTHTQRAVDAASRVARAWPGVAVAAAASNDPAGFDLVVNATPLGLQADDPMPCDPLRVAPHAAVVDILMKQASTPWMRACAARGIPAHPGFEMMVQQAPEYLSFFGYPEIASQVQADASVLRSFLQLS